MATTRIHTSTRSEELSSRARELIPGGVNSNVRLLGPATFFAHGRGSRLVDVDGNEYIDYLLGQGPNFLGHAPTDVLDAVDRACRRGMVFGAQHELELEAAEVVLDALGWAERIRFCMTGTEAIQAALRLARAVTGRERFVRFAGHYHGWIDNVLVAIDDGRAVPASAGQLPAHLGDSVTLPYNDVSALERALDRQGQDVAAVLMEPVMLNAGAIEPTAGYLEGVREICDRRGVVLIFDEVISGFRVALGGAAERYGVTPDIATYGKAMAAGWPVAAIAGDADLMDRFGTGEVNHSGTFNATVMACAATIAAVRRLAAESPYATIEERGRRLMDGLEVLAEEHGLELNLQGPPMAFHAGFGPGPVRSHGDLGRLDAERYEAFSRVLAEHGVWVAGRGIWYLSTAHDDDDIDETLERVSGALAAWGP